VAAAMRSTLEGRDMFDIHFDENVKRGLETHSPLIVRLAIEKLKAENFVPKRLKASESSTLFDRMANIARGAAQAGSVRSVTRSSHDGRLTEKKPSNQGKKRA
jgi:hypothetical protein